MRSTASSGRTPKCAPRTPRAFASKAISRRPPRRPALSKAPMFAAPVPLVGRFSLGGGNPMASDGQKDNVRGIAMHFQLPDGGRQRPAADLGADLRRQDARAVPRAAADGRHQGRGQDRRLLQGQSRIRPGRRRGSRRARRRRATRRPTISGCTPSISPTPRAIAKPSSGRPSRSAASRGSPTRTPRRRAPTSTPKRAQRAVRQGPGRVQSLRRARAAGRPGRRSDLRVAGRPQEREDGNDLDHRPGADRILRRRHLRSEQSRRRRRAIDERQDPADALARLRRVVRPRRTTQLMSADLDMRRGG